MIDPISIHYLNREHVNDLLREARAEHLARLAHAATPKSERHFSLPRPRVSWPTFAALLRRRNVAL